MLGIHTCVYTHTHTHTHTPTPTHPPTHPPSEALQVFSCSDGSHLPGPVSGCIWPNPFSFEAHGVLCCCPPSSLVHSLAALSLWPHQTEQSRQPLFTQYNHRHCQGNAPPHLCAAVPIRGGVNITNLEQHFMEVPRSGKKQQVCTTSDVLRPACVCSALPPCPLCPSLGEPAPPHPRWSL